MAYKPKTPAQLQMLDAVSEKLRVLSHPKRLLIVDYLRQMDRKMSVTEIYTALDLPQAIASQHLITLKDRGVLKSEKVGTKIFYWVPDTVSVRMLNILQKEGA